ncbi:protein O-mannosyl-transferase TMTC3-like [Gigantopelta aegis]|uniref:protein O-mannosyl-transferase TMTC3-like n=1 Tax=Gigantopelta aegis TaxID=1735272 RepID=UPI001B88C639|nr:protein O-mannosyl-transferase TMTC3-like [Gigantopelta aegis]
MDRFSMYSAVLVVVVAVGYYNSLECGFVFDDMSAVVDNKDLRPSQPFSNLFWNDFWGTPMEKERSHKSYRPLCVLTFRLNYAVSELEPISYHLINVLLHAVVCVMFMKMCCLFMSGMTSFLAALLFSVHPIHTEAVTGVVGRAEMLSSIFFLAAFMTYSKSTGFRAKIDWISLVVTVVLVTVAMLCKEQGITVIGVCCVYEVFVAQRATFRELLDFIKGIFLGKPHTLPWLKTSVIRAGFLVGSTLFLLFARIKVMGAQLPHFTTFDNPAAGSSFPARHLTYNYLLSINAWLLLNPSDLCCDWTMGTIPVIKSILDYRNLFTVIFYAVFFKLVVFALSGQTTRTRASIISLSFVVLPFIPASNLFFPVGFVVAERILYTPSMGFCMFVALGYELLLENKKNMKVVLHVLMALLLLSHGTKTIVRNIDWKSEYSLFRAALKVNQRNAKLFNNVGHALEKENRYQDALEYFKKAVSVQPDDIGAHQNVGRTYKTLNMTAEAVKAYQSALDLFPPIIPGKSYTTRIAPSHLNVYLNLASLIGKDPNRLEEADDLLKTAISMRSDYIQGYINRGDILVKLGRMEEAKQVYRQGLQIEPDNADIHYNLGVVCLEMKNPAEARIHLEEALKYDPDHFQSLFNSAILLQETGDPKHRPEALTRLRRCLKKEKSNPQVYFNIAMLSMDDNNFVEAEENFKKSIELNPTFRSALFNLALMLVNDAKRPADAIPYLNSLLTHHPDHIKGMILMGDINVNHLKDLDAAEKNFRTIIELDPKNVQANHNLCVVFVEKGDLLRAEKCLVEVIQLAPNEDYIKQHLNIVRSKIHQIKQQIQAKSKQKNGGNVKQSSDDQKKPRT